MAHSSFKRWSILSVSAFIFATVGIFASSSFVHAVDYECGTYGAGNYNEECTDTATPATDSGSSSGGGTNTGSGSSSSSSDTSTDTTSQPDTTTDIDDSSDTILLNEFSLYSTENGKTLDLKQDQAVYFLVNGEKHSITIKTITPDYIIVTIASTPTDVTIKKGEIVKRDVNGDGVDDISISYLHSTDTGASLNFAQLSEAKTDQVANATKQNGNNLWWFWLILAGFVVVGLITTIVVLKKKKRS